MMMLIPMVVIVMQSQVHLKPADQVREKENLGLVLCLDAGCEHRESINENEYLVGLHRGA